MKIFLFALSLVLLFSFSSCKKCYECVYTSGFVDECCNKKGPGSALSDDSDCAYFKEECIYNGYTLRNK